MATTMSDHLLEHLARWSAERSETQLAEEACELMLLRTSKLGWPQSGHVVAHGGLQVVRPGGKSARVIWARFEFDSPFGDDSDRAIGGFVVAYCPEAFYFYGLPVFCTASEVSVDRTIQQVTSYAIGIAQYGRCPNCGTYDLPQLVSVGSTEPSGDEAFLVYSYSCPRCRHNMVEVLD